MRELARQIATDGAHGWTPELAALIRGLFDEMALTWDQQHATNRLDALADALTRGGDLPAGVCVEGSSPRGVDTSPESTLCRLGRKGIRACTTPA